MVRIRQKNWYTTIKNRARWMTACHIFFYLYFCIARNNQNDGFFLLKGDFIFYE